MKLPNKVLNQNFFDSLQKIMEQDMPVQKSFELMKIVKELEKYLDIYNGMKNKILEKYWKRQENWNREIEKEKISKCQTEIAELDKIENEYNFELFELSENLRLSTKDIINIEKILKI